MDDANDSERAVEHSGIDFARLAQEFEQLRLLPTAEREQALDRIVTQAPGLGTELRRLFACHSDDPEELAGPARAIAGDDLRASLAIEDPAPPPHIGPYRTLRELGRGGMGVVYLAERDTADFKKQVAIKLLRGGSDRDLLRRFRTERRILAQLEHPNIAALYDGGATADGQPYVVMEYVAGNDLLRHCTAAKLGLAERLRLFGKVCRAVAHAHRALVVHRDLKPSNILVGADGEPKLLDFGIAKLLDANGETDEIAVTNTGNMLLTPEYSSPEQVRGQPITTATDVYSLGVILYELLSGRRAQPLANRSLATMIDVVCERTPPALAVDPQAGITARSLRGDLETIVAGAMHKDPARRYATASALADDLERYLAGMPVAAQRDTMGYRLRKFVRRHRLPTAAISMLLLALVAFTITTASQNRTIARERDEAVTQRQIADRITEFLGGLFEMAAPDPERAESLRVVELLDRGARSIDTDLATAPAQRAAMQSAIGRAYLGIGMPLKAEPLLVAALTTTSELAAATAGERGAQYALATCRFMLGQRADGERLMRASLTATADGPLPPLTRAQRLVILASWLRDDARYDAADALLDEAERLAGGPHLGALVPGNDIRINRAAIARERGDSARALALLTAVETYAKDHGESDQPNYASLYRQLGVTHKERNELDAARAAYTRALALTRAYAGDSHPDIENLMFEMAMLEIDFAEYGPAEKRLRELLARDVERYGAHSADVALDKAQLGMVLDNLDHVEEAEQLMQEALAVQRDVLPPNHPELPTTISNLASFYQRLGRLDEAAPLAAESYRLRRALYGPEDPRVLLAQNTLAVIELDQGHPAEAETRLREIAAARRRIQGEHPDTATSLLALATAIARQGRHEEALPIFTESARIYDTALPGAHPTQARPRIGAALSCVALGRTADAETLLREASAITHSTLGAEHTLTCYADWQLARTLARLQKSDAARALLETLANTVAAVRPDDRMLGDVRSMLAQLAGKK